MNIDKSAENAIWIEKTIKDFIETSPENTLKNQNNDKAFEMPLVGFSRGDILYSLCQEIYNNCNINWLKCPVSFKRTPPVVNETNFSAIFSLFSEHPS